MHVETINYKRKQTMAVLLQLTIILSILLANSFSQGEIVAVTEDAPCVEGIDHKLTCKLKEMRPFIEWMDVEDNATSIVHCHNYSCTLNPIYEGQYNYTCNADKNEVSLIILKIDRNYNGKKLQCSDGESSGCKILNIPEYEQSLQQIEDRILTATSACSSDRNISFKWIKINIVSNKEDEFKPKILYTNVTDCSDECGNRIKYTEAISAVSSGHGTKYYLKMAVVFGTESIVSEKTTLAYIIEEQAEIDSKLENLFLIPVILAVIVAAAVIATIFWKIRKRHALTYCGSNVRRTGNPNEGNEVKNPLLESDMETLDVNIEVYNAPENTEDEVPRASHKAEEATAAAALIKSRDEQMNSLPSLIKLFV